MLAGREAPLVHHEQLAARYPDPNAYLHAVTRRTAHNVHRGFLLPEDAARTLRNAQRRYHELQADQR